VPDTLTLSAPCLTVGTCVFGVESYIYWMFYAQHAVRTKYVGLWLVNPQQLTLSLLVQSSFPLANWSCAYWFLSKMSGIFAGCLPWRPASLRHWLWKCSDWPCSFPSVAVFLESFWGKLRIIFLPQFVLVIIVCLPSLGKWCTVLWPLFDQRGNVLERSVLQYHKRQIIVW
jgi:hypothetical protein